MDCELLKYLLAYFGIVGTIIMWNVALTHPNEDTATIAFVMTGMVLAVGLASMADCEILELVPLFIFRETYY